MNAFSQFTSKLSQTIECFTNKEFENVESATCCGLGYTVYLIPGKDTSENLDGTVSIVDCWECWGYYDTENEELIGTSTDKEQAAILGLIKLLDVDTRVRLS